MIDIRRARIADAEALARLSASVQALHVEALPHLFKPVGPDTFPASAVRALLEDDAWIVLVACVGDEPIGYASAQIEHRAETPFRYAADRLVIQWMGVLGPRRRTGVGRALIDAMRIEASMRGLSTLMLDVWAFNSAASAFYHAVGFRPLRHILSMDVDSSSAGGAPRHG